MATDHGPPWTRNNGYETLDFIPVVQQWNSTVTDSETDTEGFIPSDHYPVTAKIKIQLEAISKKKKRTERIKYGTVGGTQNKVKFGNK